MPVPGHERRPFKWRPLAAVEVAAKIQDTGAIHYPRGVIKILDRPALEKMSCECEQRDHDHYDHRERKPNGEAVSPTAWGPVPLTTRRDITGILVACHLNSTGEMERYNVLGSEQFAFTGRIRFFALESRFCCVLTCCGLAASSGPRRRGTCGSDLWNNRTWSFCLGNATHTSRLSQRSAEPVNPAF
jgi:hypothetical protein